MHLWKVVRSQGVYEGLFALNEADSFCGSLFIVSNVYFCLLEITVYDCKMIRVKFLGLFNKYLLRTRKEP